MSKTIVFFGNERLATGVATQAPILQALISAGYHVCAVVSNYEHSASRSARDLEIARVASKNNIPLLLPKRLSEIKAQLARYEAAAGVLVAYGKIVPENIIDIFPGGIINIHPSLLPKHRGPTPIESVILQDEKKTGVSLMHLTKAMDAGPIYAQTEFVLHGNETKQELADHMLEVSRAMLLDLLPDILSGEIEAVPQDDSQATYDNLIAKDNGIISWDKPAEQLEREIRAYAGWPNSKTAFGGIEATATKAHVLSLAGSPGKTTIAEKLPVVYCKKDALALDRLKPAGKKEMTGEAFLAGYKHTFLAAKPQ